MSGTISSEKKQTASYQNMYIKIRVKTGVKREVVAQTGPDSFDISIKEKAERNEANDRVREIVAAQVGVPTNKVRIVKGHKSTSKIVLVSA